MLFVSGRVQFRVLGSDHECGDRLNKETIPSRAYVAFRTEEQLALFSRSFDGHVFRDKAGA